MDVEKSIQDQIAALEKQAEGLRAILIEVQRAKRKHGDPSMRFFDWRPLDAVRTILQENGGRMKRSDLVRVLVEGGLTHAKKRGMANIRISIDLNIENENLIQKGDYIQLPK